MTRSRAKYRRIAVGTVTAVALLLAVSAEAPQAVAASAASVARPIYENTSYSFAERAADLVSRMTLPEKVLQLRTNSAPAIPRLGVQAYTYWSEGQHGINRLGANTNSGTVNDGPEATSFPTNQASTMSWDPSLIYDETTAISDEARGELDKSLWGVGQNNIGPDKNAYGNLTYWAPTVNMDRDPRWGRTDEAFGEDPYLVSTMAGQFVNGYQGQTMSGKQQTPYLKVAATAKHFALNNEEAVRHSGSSNASDADIRNYYTPQFRSLVEDAHVAGLMTSYNAINGTPAPADTYTANELAQRTWGFDGYTTSDCGAVGDIYSAGSHNWAPPGWTTSVVNGNQIWTSSATGKTVPAAAGAQAYALRAGTQLNCTGTEYTVANIQAALDAGILSTGVIDDALVRTFTIRMQTGEFDPPSKVKYTKITKAQIQSPQHQALARKVADNSVVLLKNQPVAGTSSTLLPVKADTVHSVVIVGNLANTVTLGGYSGSPTYTVNAVQGITAALKTAAPTATVLYDGCGTSTTVTAAATCSAATLTAMKTADLVVVVAGTDGSTAGEEHDRSGLAMPGNYLSLISQVHAVNNPRTVLAMQADGPIAIETVRDDFPAMVFSGYNGQAQGGALADVLFGKQDPAGHLDFTWYKDDSQLPDISNYGLSPSDTGGLGRTYQYFTGTPSYPFGYGLSYSTFAYSKIRVDQDHVTPDGTVKVSFTVTNTGTKAGSTVAQLYANSPTVKGVTLPTNRLIGFQKTNMLQPGAHQGITLKVKMSDLALYDESAQREIVYPGKYQFHLATDADNNLATLPVTVSGRLTAKVQYVTVQPDQVVYAPGQTLNLKGTNPWIADDTAQAAQNVPAAKIVEAVNNDESFLAPAQTHATYASSNTKVATVSSSGIVTAKSAGAATIRVTVNGVTGTTPIVVQQPFTLTAPSLVNPGRTFTATTKLTNPTKGTTLTGLKVSLDLPSGWTATAANPSSAAKLRPGQTVVIRWKVTVPASGAAGPNELTATATFTGKAGTASSSASTAVQVPYASLAAAYNNVGVTDDTNAAVGSIDGAGRSYSAQALSAATPSLTPGQSVSHDGATFTWPATPTGTPDNVVASGQTVAVNGSGTALSIIGAANNGTATGDGTITYTDGSSTPFTLSYSDWWANTGSTGSDVLASAAYLNSTNGTQNNKVSMYYAAIPVTAGKTVQYVTLPNISSGPVTGLAMHIFAVQVTG